MPNAIARLLSKVISYFEKKDESFWGCREKNEQKLMRSMTKGYYIHIPSYKIYKTHQKSTFSQKIQLPSNLFSFESTVAR